MTTTFTIYEDNSGSVYLVRGDRELLVLGPVTPDLYGCAAPDAEGWHTGDWEPNEGAVYFENVSLVDLTQEGLTHIATWTPQNGLVSERDSNGELVAGAGGQNYLGVHDE